MSHFSSILCMFLPKLPAASDFQPVQDSQWPLYTPCTASFCISSCHLHVPVSPYIPVQIQEVKSDWSRSSCGASLFHRWFVWQVCGLVVRWVGLDSWGFLRAVGTAGTKTQSKLFFMKMVEIPVWTISNLIALKPEWMRLHWVLAWFGRTGFYFWLLFNKEIICIN